MQELYLINPSDEEQKDLRLENSVEPDFEGPQMQAYIVEVYPVIGSDAGKVLQQNHGSGE